MSTAEANSTGILVLCRDLMFASKIRSAAAASSAGEIKLLRDPAQLIGDTGRALIVDLGQAEALEAARSWKSANRGSKLIGFASHVETETIAHAKSAGFDRVLTRGQFAQSLPELLSEEV